MTFCYNLQTQLHVHVGRLILLLCTTDNVVITFLSKICLKLCYNRVGSLILFQCAIWFILRECHSLFMKLAKFVLAWRTVRVLSAIFVLLLL